LLAIISIILYLGGLYQLALPVGTGHEIRGVDPDSLDQINSTNSIIPNQYVVTLRQDTSTSAIQSLVDEVQSKGAQIIGTYDQAFTGFSFLTPDANMANEIVNLLRDNPQVESIEPDRELSIQ
jgi:hypothetical protein